MSDKPRLWIISFILVFAAGIAAGVFGHNWREAARRDANKPPSMETWAKELGLSADQQAKLREVFKANDTRIRGDARLKELRAERFKRFGELRKQLQAEIDAVLTPEQKAKNDAMIKRHEEERRTSAARRDPPPAPGRDDRGSGGGDPASRRAPRPLATFDTRTDSKTPFQAYHF